MIVNTRKGAAKRVKENKEGWVVRAPAKLRQDVQVGTCVYIVGHSTKYVDEAKENKKKESHLISCDQE